VIDKLLEVAQRQLREAREDLVGPASLPASSRNLRVAAPHGRRVPAGESRSEGKREVDTNFIVGLFDFPMIDSTRLSGGERTSVSLTALNQNVLSVALAYFPASRERTRSTASKRAFISRRSCAAISETR
jgi:hypothetical protein